MLSRFRSRLAFKAVAAIAIPMLATLMIASAASGVLSYRTANAQLEDRIREIAQDDIDHITEHLWELDIGAVQSQLDNYVELGGLTGASLVDETGKTLRSGTLKQDPSALIHSYPLVHQTRNGPVRLGILTLEASRDESWALARTRVIALVTIAALTVLISIALMHRLLDLNVLSPIKRIAQDLRQRPGDWRDFRIDLNRGPHPDELDDLVGSIHEMRDDILTSQGESAHNQARLAQAAKLAGLGYATIDLVADRFLECDENYAAMHGNTVEQMLGLLISTDIIEAKSHPAEVARSREVRRCLLRGENATNTSRIKTGQGEFRHLKKIYTTKPMPDGRPGVVDIVAQDLTELHVMKEHLLQTQKMEAIGKLTGGVAHDVNNFLAVISGNLELLRDGVKTAPLTDYVDTAMIAVTRGATLTQRLLAFARKQTLSPEVTDISALVSDSASLFQTSIGATIRLGIHAGQPMLSARVDRAQLDAVLLNLVVNARDAMPDGGALTIEVRNIRIDDTDDAGDGAVTPGDYVCISVTDSGHGMTAETAERAFDPFFTTKAVGGGTGLGLSMAFGFAKQSGGHLTIDSDLGAGTTVRLYLPRVQPVAAGVLPAPGEPAATLQDLRVLLVEDDESLRELIVRQLASRGCVVTAAADGDAAIDLARAQPHFDILLSDIVLPGSMNGRRLAREIAGIVPGCPVVLMSGFADVAEPEDGDPETQQILLQKPFSLTSLQQALTKALSAEGAGASPDARMESCG